MKITSAAYVITCLCLLSVTAMPTLCWSNGGYSANLSNPDYGTHDWIAQHALDYLPAQEKQYITDNLAVYLLGTELPDNSNDTIGGIGDTTKHHIYYSSAGVLIDDASALRANETFNQALAYLKSNDYGNAAKSAGTLTHYISDVAVFGHVMGASTAWGTEVHHSDYEDYVDTRTNSYTDTFNKYLAYDGSLSTTTAYQATTALAYDTTFGGSDHLNCTWMDTNYNWSNSVFTDRCGESLNLSVNVVADVLHSLYIQLYPPLTTSPTPTPAPPTPTSTPSPTPTPAPTPSPTSSPNPTATPAPTAAPTSQPSAITPTPTPQLTATPKPTNSATTSPQPTPTVPEFPVAALLIAALIAFTAIAMLNKKKQKNNLRFNVR